MTTAEILSRLEHVTKTGDGWQARCLAHNDKAPSLSIKEGDDGRTLLKCHAGCSIESICASLGIKQSDLFLDTRHGAAKPPAGREISFDWQRCLSALTAKAKQELADWRGYSPAFVDCLHREMIVGFHAGDIAFAVHKAGRVVGCHYLADRAEKLWRYHPKGNGTQPLVFGHPGSAVYVLCFESQWDAFAVMDKCSWHTGPPEGYALFITRGADNGKLIKGQCSPDAVIYAFVQNDKPDKKGRIAGEDWLTAIASFAGCKEVLRVATPAAHKDPNDWTLAGATQEDFEIAIRAARPVTAPDAVQDLPGNEEPYAVPDATAEANPLPDIVDAATFLQQKIEAPPELVVGVIHQGSKVAFGGGSKTFKTWMLTDLALAVATGEPWLSFKTKKGRVLFLNFEIQPPFFQDRIRAVADAKHITLAPGMVDLWNLRGQAAAYASIFPRIIERVKDGGYALIVLDPIYKCYGGIDENSASAVAGLMNAIEGLAVATGAAVAFGAHYSKGNQAGKESIDRISGSGVFARDPDSILSFTRHEQQDAFAVELTLRNFKPVASFGARWLYPLMRRDDELDPAKLKQGTGRPKKHTVEKILKCLAGQRLTTVQWKDRASSEKGVPKTQFYELLDEARGHPGLSQTLDGQWFYEAPRDGKA